MILVISTCKDKLSELEFVEPLKRLIGNCSVANYREIDEKEILGADKIIISGTCLKDFEYGNYDFEWLKKFDKPLLGICAGMQVIARTFGAELIDCKNIGVKKVKVLATNKLMDKDFKAYFLHTKTVQGGDLDILATIEERPAIVKHKSKQIYGCVFHPEVMNADIIENFLKLR